MNARVRRNAHEEQGASTYFLREICDLREATMGVVAESNKPDSPAASDFIQVDKKYNWDKIGRHAGRSGGIGRRARFRA